MAAPDGALWFTEPSANQIGRITLDGTITEYPHSDAGEPRRPADYGPDDAVWFAEIGGDRIGRMSLDGEVTEYPVPGMTPVGITVGPDGAIWFTGFNSNEIGRITVDGTVERFPVPTPKSVPYHIAAGPDGALWFTEQDANKIGRLEPSAVSTRAASSPTQLDPVLTLAGSPQPFAALPNGLAVDHQGNIYVGEDRGVASSCTCSTHKDNPWPRGAAEQALVRDSSTSSPPWRSMSRATCTSRILSTCVSRSSMHRASS